jgi:hypothetical protein
MPAQRRLADPKESAFVIAMATAIGNQVFAGRPPHIIGAVLAELMSTLLLNHQVPSDRAKQEALREEILTEWCATVRGLVAVQTDPPASETLQ